MEAFAEPCLAARPQDLDSAKIIIFTRLEYFSVNAAGMAAIPCKADSPIQPLKKIGNLPLYVFKIIEAIVFIIIVLSLAMKGNFGFDKRLWPEFE